MMGNKKKMMLTPRETNKKSQFSLIKDRNFAAQDVFYKTRDHIIDELRTQEEINDYNNDLKIIREDNHKLMELFKKDLGVSETKNDLQQQK